MSEDHVYLTGLCVDTLIGVYDFERVAPQQLLLDLILTFDCRPAGQTDRLEQTLDYDRLATRIRAWSQQQSFRLLEAYAEHLCRLIHAEFNVRKMSLTINKPTAVKGCSAVGIAITRRFEC